MSVTEESKSLKQESKSTRKQQMKAARFAGLFYLLLAVLGGFSILYLDGLIYWENSTKTVENLENNENMIRVSIVSGLLGQISFLFLAISFYYLFKPFDETSSIILLVLVVASVPIAMFNAITSFAAVHIISEPSYLDSWEVDQRESWIMLFLKLNAAGIYIAGFFWGLWLVPLGHMAYRSGYFPRFIGIFLMIGGIAYVFDSAAYFIAGDAVATTTLFVTIFSSIGEFSMLLWLLIKGPTIESSGE